jgi:hypothetical protein
MSALLSYHASSLVLFVKQKIEEARHKNTGPAAALASLYRGFTIVIDSILSLGLLYLGLLSLVGLGVFLITTHALLSILTSPSIIT